MRRVDLQLAANRVEHDQEAAVTYPQCRRSFAGYDHAPQRHWRYLDVMQFATIIPARVLGCQRPEHGMATVQVPWAEPHGQFTLMFEAFAVTVIQAARSFVQAIEILKADWHTIRRSCAGRWSAGCGAVRPRPLRKSGWTRRASVAARTTFR